MMFSYLIYQQFLKKVKSILIEINDDFEEQSNKSKFYLENASLVLD